MSWITVEHNPSPMKLDVLNVEGWPVWSKEVSTFEWSYNIIETEATTRAIASFAAITNPGSAFERITPMNNNPDTAAYQMHLNEIKAKLDGGQ